MRASNPLIAVGISTVVILGTTLAASAQAESGSDPDSVSPKERNTAEAQASRFDRQQTVKPAQSEAKSEIAQPEAFVSEVVGHAPVNRRGVQVAGIEIFVAPDSSLTRSMQRVESIASLPHPSSAKATPAPEGTAQAPASGETEAPASTEEALPEGATEPTQVEQGSPAADETTGEPAQQGEETAPPALEDQPPQDTETLPPEDEAPVELPNAAPPSDQPPGNESPSDRPPTTDRTPGQNQIQPSAPPNASTPNPLPEYLDPNANPLSFPTTPEEVEIIGTQPLTLRQAIEAGLRNNQELQVTRLELQRLRASLRETQAEEYPSITANTQLNYSASEQPDSITTQETDPTTGQPTGETSFEVDGTDVSRSLTLGGTLELSYSLYTSGRRAALIESAERQVRFQELQVEADTEDLILQITNDYYDLQEADEQVQIFRATLEESQRSLQDAEALERAGVGTRFDVLQAQVDVANAQQNLRNQQSQQEIARRQLAERLNLNQSVTLAAADPIEVAGVWDLSLEETIVAAYRNRAELEQQLVQREIGNSNRRAALAQLGPQVTFQTSYGLNNTLASDPDSPSEDVGFLSDFQAALGISWLLFDGGAARAQARQAEANIGIAESNFANQRDQIRFDVEQAYAQLQSNFENIQTTALAVQQAIEALRLARLRFQAGVGTQTDVLQAQTALTQARFNNLQAIQDYNRALASLQRQVSNYPEGYLNEVP